MDPYHTRIRHAVTEHRDDRVGKVELLFAAAVLVWGEESRQSVRRRILFRRIGSRRRGACRARRAVLVSVSHASGQGDRRGCLRQADGCAAWHQCAPDRHHLLRYDGSACSHQRCSCRADHHGAGPHGDPFHPEGLRCRQHRRLRQSGRNFNRRHRLRRHGRGKQLYRLPVWRSLPLHHRSHLSDRAAIGSVWRSTDRRTMSDLPRVLLYFGAAALIAVFPFISPNDFYLRLAEDIAIWAIAAIGLNLLLGYSGQLSLGQSAFFALGAYGSGIVATTYNWPLWLSIPLGVLVASAAGIVMGLVALRARTHYLAMATLAFGFIIEIVCQRWVGLTGGSMGLIGVPQLNFGDFARGPTYFFWFVAACYLLVQTMV